MKSNNPKKDKKEQEPQTFLGMLPSISSLVTNVTNLTILPLVGLYDLNENEQNDPQSNPGPSNSEPTTMERRIVPDPGEFARASFEQIQESPTYQQYKRLNTVPNTKKKPVPVIYSPVDEVKDATLPLDSPEGAEKKIEEPPKKDKSKTSILKKIFGRKNKHKKQNKPSSMLSSKGRPKIIIQTPECPDSPRISSKTGTDTAEEASVESFPKLPSKVKTEEELFFPTLNMPSTSNKQASYILSTLSQASTSKQMYIPFDEFCKINTNRCKNISPVETPSTSPVRSLSKTPSFKKDDTSKKKFTNTPGSKTELPEPTLKKAVDVCKKPLANTPGSKTTITGASLKKAVDVCKKPLANIPGSKTTITGASLKKAVDVCKKPLANTPGTKTTIAGASLKKAVDVCKKPLANTPGSKTTITGASLKKAIDVCKKPLANTSGIKSTSTASPMQKSTGAIKKTTASSSPQTKESPKSDSTSTPKKPLKKNEPKEFINRKNKNKKRAMRRHLRTAQQGIGEISTRMIERGMAWFQK